MSIWLERFALAVLAAILGAIVLTNPWGLDRLQRAGLVIAIVGLSVFAAGTVERMRNGGAPPAALSEGATATSAPAPPEISSAGNTLQKSTGNNSPNVVQGANSIFQQGNNNVASIGPPVRDISASAAAALTTKLSPFKGTVVELSIATESEATRFGNQLTQILTDAGWGGNANQAMFAGQVPSGLIIYAEGPAAAAAETLTAELVALGIQVTYTGKGNDRTEGTKMSIGIGQLPVK